MENLCPEQLHEKRHELVARAKEMNQEQVVRLLLAIVECESLKSPRERKARALKIVSIYIDCNDISDNLFLSLQTLDQLLLRKNAGALQFFTRAKFEIFAYVSAEEDLRGLFLL